MPLSQWPRSRRVILAVVTSALWLGYMVIGLAVINTLFPTIEGQGPSGTAAFIGLLSGFFVTGIIMWAFSD
ncbi:MAG TPA: hypothetical protein VGO32_05305 [Candidatus Limnocylindria bacterium]|jgi:hypothetical protein|nr:hypothetical protein [Candidatus Limnocylindria bacterium]